MKDARSRRLLSVFGAGLLLVIASRADATAEQIFHLTIVNQAFEPDTLTIPAGQRVKIMVMNKDIIPAEFESSEAHREVVIPGKTELPVYVGPLEPGTYHFINDFHPQRKGTLIVKKTGR
jgi:plastocyanin